LGFDRSSLLEWRGLLPYPANGKDSKICILIADFTGSFAGRIVPGLRLVHILKAHNDNPVAGWRSPECGGLAVEHNVDSTLFLDGLDGLRKELPDVVILIFEGYFGDYVCRGLLNIGAIRGPCANPRRSLSLEPFKSPYAKSEADDNT
jgi:hypothetical protein